MPRYNIDIVIPVRVAFKRQVESSIPKEELSRLVESALRSERCDVTIPDTEQELDLPSPDDAVLKASVDHIDTHEIEVEVYVADDE